MAPISRSCWAEVRACRCRPTSAHCLPTIVGQAMVPPLTRHELDYAIGLEYSIGKIFLPPRLLSLITRTPARAHLMAPRDTFWCATTWPMRCLGDYPSSYALLWLTMGFILQQRPVAHGCRELCLLFSLRLETPCAFQNILYELRVDVG